MKTGEIYDGDVLLGTFTPSSPNGRRMRMLSLVIHANTHIIDKESGKIAMAELATNFIEQAKKLQST